MSKKNGIDKKTLKKGLLPYLFIAIIMLFVFYYFNVTNNKKHDFTYDQFMEKLSNDKIKKLEMVPKGSGYVYEVTGTLDNYKEDEYFEVRLPLSEEVMKRIVEASDNQDFKLTVYPDPDANTWLILLGNFLPIAIIVIFGYWFLSKQMAGNKS